LFSALLFAAPMTAQLVTNNGDTIFISSGATLYVRGSFNNIDNGSNVPYIQNNGTLKVDSNWQAASDMIYGGQDSFIASGAGPQTIAGLHYHNFLVPGGGTKTFSSSAYIKNSIAVTNGFINTNTNLVTLDSMASITEDSADYLYGYLQMTKYLSQNNTFHFGNMGVDITPSGASPGMTTVTRGNGPGTAQMGNGNTGIERYFQVNPAYDHNLNAQVVFHYYPGELNSDPQADLAMFRSEDSGLVWSYIGYTTRDASLNTLTTNGIDSFSRFTLGSSITPLPVKLLNFNAILVNKTDGYLTWETASELNNNYWDIERSVDGSTWLKAGEEPGFGTTSDIHYYNFTDPNINLLLSPIVYYRLKQVDYNGNFTYSQIRELNLATVATNNLKVWYNQSDDKVYIDYSTSNTSENLHLVLTDMQGKIIVSQNIAVSQGFNEATVNMVGLAKAIYNINIVNGEMTKTFRVLKD